MLADTNAAVDLYSVPKRGKDFFGYIIGNTPLVEASELMERYGGSRIHVKDESFNPITHTAKDRRNLAVLQRDLSIRDPVYYVDVTAGNGGTSFGELCRIVERETGKKRCVINIVDDDLSKKTVKRLGEYGPVVKMNLNGRVIPPHEMIHIALGHIPRKDRDVARVRTIESLDNYKTLSEELYDVDFTHLAGPVGAGELIKSTVHNLNGKGNAHIIGGTTEKNVCASDKRFVGEPDYSPADKLACGYSRWQDPVREIFRKPGNVLYTLSPEKIEEEIRVLNDDYFLDVGPNSGSTFAAVYEHAKKGLLTPDDRVVIIKTDRWKDHIEGLKKRRPWGTYAARGLGALAILSFPFFEGPGYETRLRRAEAQAKVDFASFETRYLDNNAWHGLKILYAYRIGVSKTGEYVIDEETMNTLNLITDRWGTLAAMRDPEKKVIVESFMQWAGKRYKP